MTLIHLSLKEQDNFFKEVKEFLDEVAEYLGREVSVLHQRRLRFRGCCEDLAPPEFGKHGILFDPDNALYRRFLVQVYSGDIQDYFPKPVPPQAVHEDGWCNVFRYICHMVFQQNRTDRVTMLHGYIPALIPEQISQRVLEKAGSFSSAMFGCPRSKFVYELREHQ